MQKSTTTKYLALILFLCICHNDLIAQVVINEFQASNSSTLADEDGDFPDWIELFNAGETTQDLSGWSLTDNDGNPDKWIFPATSIAAGQYLVLFASSKNRRVSGSELHTNFNLSANGEYLGLFDEFGNQQFEYSPQYGLQITDVSFGLSGSSASHPAGYLPSPTPGALNGTANPTPIARIPDLGLSSSKFTSSFDLAMSSPDDLSIRYTLDGSRPSSTIGIVYVGPITISTTTVLRAVAYGVGYQESKVSTASYFFLNDLPSQMGVPTGYPSTWATESADYDMDPNIVNDPAYATRLIDGLNDLPIVSIVMDKDSLFDATRGIYQNTTLTGFDWERSTHIELISEAGELEFAVDAGIRIQGGASRLPHRSPKHNFRIAFRNEYGPSKLNSNIFHSEPGGQTATSTFDTFVLKAGYNFTWYHFTAEQRGQAEYTRDTWVSDSGLAMGSAATHVRNVHLFLNGLYWGLYKIVERPDASWASEYFGGSKDDYDALNSGEAINGDDLAWQELLNLAENDLANSSNYENVADRLDLVDFIDYLILNQYGGNTDWAHHNWYGNRYRLGGKYRFTAWDSEHTLKSPAENVVTKDDEDSPTHLYQRLKVNEDFLTLFADRVYKHFYNNGALSPDSSIARYSKRVAKIDRAIIAESARWGDYRQEPPHERDNEYVTEVDRILTQFFPQRHETVLQQYRDESLYPANDPPSFLNATINYNNYEGAVDAGFQLTISNSPNANSGTIFYTIDGTDPRAIGGANQGIDGGDSVELTISGVVRVNARVRQNGEWSALQTGLFVAPQMLDKLVLNEIHYHPLPAGIAGQPGYVDGDEFEFLEIKNTAEMTLQLQGVSISEGVSFDFPAGSTIPANGFIVLAENAVEFENRYGFVPDGQYGDKLSNSGERIVLNDISGVVIDSLTYGDSNPWMTAPDGSGPSLSLDPAVDLSNEGPANWQQSTEDGGTPGATNSNVIPQLQLAVKIILGGAWTGSEMRSSLNSNSMIPTNQPYAGAPDKTVSQQFLENNPDVVDWVWVELRTGTGASSAVAKEAFLINKDGELLTPTGESWLGFAGLSENSYYVVIGHRNHLSIMSANLEGFSFDQGLALDFTTTLSAAYTSNELPMKDIGDGKFGLWPGDASGNSEVNYTGANNDRVLILSRAGGPGPFDSVAGYFSEDINLDGVVKYAGANNDRIDILDTAGGPSAFASRQSQVPD